MSAYPRWSHTTTTGRRYTWPGEAESWPSVTTILGVLNKPALVPWSARTAAEYVVDNWQTLHDVYDHTRDATARAAVVDLVKGAPARQRDARALDGSRVHDMAESLAAGADLSGIPADMRSWAEGLARWMDDWQPEFHACEFQVFSRTGRYAGTCDFIARIPAIDRDGLVIGDYKTSRPNPRTGHGIYPEVALQLAAYRFGEWMAGDAGVAEPIPAVSGAVAVNIGPGVARVVPVSADEDDYDAFLALRAVWEWRQRKDRVSGPLLIDYSPDDPFAGLPGSGVPKEEKHGRGTLSQSA